MKLVYIAGPFRAPTAWQMAENVREAERWGLEVARRGAMPVIPHANTHLFHGQLTEEFWVRGTLLLLERCDAGFFIPNWTKSVGANAEYSYCEMAGTPVFGPGHLENGDFERWVVESTPAEIRGEDDNNDG